ncbi:hypothetical protein AAFF_G00113640 [Aldrovandia affinis]|uniref:Uncharacterized protein n=1 Tax=Aldrovandia affinis TaxID=143900 RepID=A0AAD7WAY1_9TELE|nr:hypothetical protein AAFF_G00113640 [Aldrovandia affinis]
MARTREQLFERGLRMAHRACPEFAGREEATLLIRSLEDEGGSPEPLYWVKLSPGPTRGEEVSNRFAPGPYEGRAGSRALCKQPVCTVYEETDRGSFGNRV